MYCNRLKRQCQCTPGPRSRWSKGAGILQPFNASLLDFLQNSCTLVYQSNLKYLLQNRAKRQEKLGLLALFFWLLKSNNMIKEII